MCVPIPIVICVWECSANLITQLVMYGNRGDMRVQGVLLLLKFVDVMQCTPAPAPAPATASASAAAPTAEGGSPAPAASLGLPLGGCDPSLIDLLGDAISFQPFAQGDEKLTAYYEKKALCGTYVCVYYEKKAL